MRVLHVHEEHDRYIADLHTLPDPAPGAGERVTGRLPERHNEVRQKSFHRRLCMPHT